MKLRFFVLVAFLLASVSALADGQMLKCSVYETNDQGKVSDALYTRGVPLVREGNATLSFQNDYLGYRMDVANTADESLARVSFSFRSNNGAAVTVQDNLDLKSRSQSELRLIVNSFKPDGDFISEVRLICGLE